MALKVGSRISVEVYRVKCAKGAASSTDQRRIFVQMKIAGRCVCKDRVIRDIMIAAVSIEPLHTRPGNGGAAGVVVNLCDLEKIGAVCAGVDSLKGGSVVPKDRIANLKGAAHKVDASTGELARLVFYNRAVDESIGSALQFEAAATNPTVVAVKQRVFSGYHTVPGVHGAAVLGQIVAELTA